ncbi:MAG: cardiolipin synthase [Oscillospiraceae bacterium]|nr:cardiolipin synthase [Oscillospiraceae bacterium]
MAVLLNILSVLAVLYIINKPDKPGYKVTWIVFIMALPVFGGLFYLVFKLQSSARNFKKNLNFYTAKAKEYLVQNDEVRENFENNCPEYATQTDYLIKTVGFPVYQNTYTEFLSTGELQYAYMIEEIKKAEKYIFIEFFIIEEGHMWDTLLEILVEKAAHGVDVRVMYDDVGCFLKLPGDFKQMLHKHDIKCTVFNPFHPIWSTVQNNRDHRKIVVIDGVTAFTGGSNIADEYINAIERFGHWKDAGILIKGDAVWSFTVMYLQLWDTLNASDEDYDLFRLEREYDYSAVSGFVQPYDDSPLDIENVGEHVYMQIINRSDKYLYITTPYLIIDDNILSALCLAAKSGIDVRIITPHVPDKKIVHLTTRSYYNQLINSGVKIYEYTPGFIHSKIFVSDDMVATVGTANLDFRSLYLHFECGALLHNTASVFQIRDDFLELLTVCRQISIDDFKSNILMRILKIILKLCAPLM